MDLKENKEFDLTSTNELSKSSKQKFLIFILNNDKYGIPLSTVKEIIGMTEITNIPQMPTFFTGLINLRGRIISVMDLRKKIGVNASEYMPKKTSIIIVDIDGLLLGAIVDDVKEVENLDLSQIEKDIDLKKTSHREYISGVVKSKNAGLTLLLDIEKTLDSQELATLRSEKRTA